MKNKMFLKIINNRRGALSADFIFSLILGISMCLVLFVMASTFALVEVGQYIAFSSARAMIAGNFTSGNGCTGGGTAKVQDQANMACEKFNTLVNHPFLVRILNNVWFELKKDPDFIMLGKNSSDLFTEYQSEQSTDKIVQTGVRLNFNPKVLQTLKVSLISPPAENIQGNNGFAKITGLLVREPTIEECAKFMKNRFEAISKLDPRFSKQLIVDPFINSIAISPPDIYSLQMMVGEDNGC